ncbi:MAG TPA: hypothetical protein VFN70_18260 [Burkholderiales bacterium]|nr:hypothetical protein [Burkholderiales bacterium]
MNGVRHQAIRHALKMPKDVVAKLCGVSIWTIERFELDALAVKSPAKREAVVGVYARLGELARPLLEAA